MTRRDLLQRAWILPATPFLARWEAAAQDVSPVMVKLSTYMAGARNIELPDKVVQDAKHHILDSIAAMVSGSELPPGRDAIQFARTYGGGQKVATVLRDHWRDSYAGRAGTSFWSPELKRYYVAAPASDKEEAAIPVYAPQD